MLVSPKAFSGLIFGICVASAMVSAPKARAAARPERPATERIVIEAQTVCRTYVVGNKRYTEVCEPGYTCSDNKCVPGQDILKKHLEEQEKKANGKEKAAPAQPPNASALSQQKASLDTRMKKAANLSGASAPRRAAESKIYNPPSSNPTCTYSCAYDNWNGNPKIIPSPRYRNGSGASRPVATNARPAAPAQQPRPVSAPTAKPSAPMPGLAQLPQVVGLLAPLLRAIDTLPRNDPTRPQVIEKVKTALKGAGLDPEEVLCGQAAGARKQPYELRWRVPDIPDAVRQSGVCDGAGDFEACASARQGDAIMWAEPEIGARCRAQSKTAAEANTCGRNMFLNAWQKRGGALVPLANSGGKSSCLEQGQVRPQPPGANQNSLRDLLKKKLAEKEAETPAQKDEPAEKPAATAPTPPPEAQPERVAAKDPEFCEYFAQRAKRGELTMGGGMVPAECTELLKNLQTMKKPEGVAPDFSMAGSETDAAIRKTIEGLLPPPSPAGADKAPDATPQTPPSEKRP